MKQLITLYSQDKDSDFFFTQKEDQHWTRNWAICRDELEDFFELDDKPLEITVQLSDKPSKNSYPVTAAHIKEAVIELSNGEKNYRALTGFAIQALLTFNIKRKVPSNTPVHVSIY